MPFKGGDDFDFNNQTSMKQAILATLVGVSLAVDQNSLKGQLLKPAPFSFLNSNKNDSDIKRQFPNFASPFNK